MIVSALCGKGEATINADTIPFHSWKAAPFKKGQIIYHTQLLWLCAFLMVIAGSGEQSAVPNTHYMSLCAEL